MCSFLRFLLGDSIPSKLWSRNFRRNSVIKKNLQNFKLSNDFSLSSRKFKTNNELILNSNGNPSNNNKKSLFNFDINMLIIRKPKVVQIKYIENTLINHPDILLGKYLVDKIHKHSNGNMYIYCHNTLSSKAIFDIICDLHLKVSRANLQHLFVRFGPLADGIVSKQFVEAIINSDPYLKDKQTYFQFYKKLTLDKVLIYTIIFLKSATLWLVISLIKVLYTISLI